MLVFVNKGDLYLLIDFFKSILYNVIKEVLKMDDWRLNGQEQFLLGVKLIKKRFKYRGGYDHRHCDFCWDKISEEKEDLNIGYCSSLSDDHWVCETCFNDFKDMFKWTVIDETAE